MTALERVAIAAAFGYLLALGWAMQRLEYDVWGAMIMAPLLIVVSIPLINRAFSGRLTNLRPLAIAGLGLKLAGAVTGYFVRSGAYAGTGDANRYHELGSALAADVRSGEATLLAVIPFERGTVFVSDVTGLIYTFVGSSKLAGYFVFAWLSYWGLALTLLAGIKAVPLLARKRYAVLIFMVPSLVYWGSSIGKEAIVGCALGITNYGLAIVIAERHRARLGVALFAIGIAITAMVRPHFAAIWVGAAVIALGLRSIANLSGRRRDGSRLGAFFTLGLAAIGFVIVSTLTLSYLNPNDTAAEDAPPAITDRISEIFDTTEERTNIGTSSFTPIPVNTPFDYPYAAARTLTRPLIFEVGSVNELLPALEMTVLLLIAARWWRRLVNLPRLLLGNPYLVFAVVCVVTFGVAFASIGNLGLLVRQRTLIVPLLLLLWCVPEFVPIETSTPDTLRTAQRWSTRRNHPAAQS